jgi:hypothetical protein
LLYFELKKVNNRQMSGFSPNLATLSVATQGTNKCTLALAKNFLQRKSLDFLLSICFWLGGGGGGENESFSIFF